MSEQDNAFISTSREAALWLTLTSDLSVEEGFPMGIIKALAERAVYPTYCVFLQVKEAERLWISRKGHYRNKETYKCHDFWNQLNPKCVEI